MAKKTHYCEVHVFYGCDEGFSKFFRIQWDATTAGKPSGETIKNLAVGQKRITSEEAQHVDYAQTISKKEFRDAVCRGTKVDVMFANLDAETQEELLNLYSIDDPKEANWDTIPIFTLER